MSAEARPVRLGELLIQAGILKPAELENAVSTAKETGLPIGRVLLMSGAFNQGQLDAAVQAQSRIRDNLLDIDAAIEALKLVTYEGVSFEEALRLLGCADDKPETPTAKLGDLLLQSQLITPAQLDHALEMGQETGLPLGRVLVLNQAISDELLSAALTAQVFIRDGKISKDQAIQGLKSARRRRVSLEASLQEHGYYRQPARPSIKMGELFIRAGVLTEGAVTNALELSLTQQKAVGQVLVEHGQINSKLLDAALRVQEMVVNLTLTPEQAVDALTSFATGRTSLERAVAIPGPSIGRSELQQLCEILKVTGLVPLQALNSFCQRHNGNDGSFLGALVSEGLISEEMLNAAMRCRQLLLQNFIRMEQVLVLLNHCYRHKLDVDAAMQDLGWVTRTRMNLE